MFSRLLKIFALTWLCSFTADSECRQACDAVEVAISDASKVYYPGEYDCEQPLRR